MDHSFKNDLCVIGAGRIGLPWAAVLAATGKRVSCVDVDKSVVKKIKQGQAPFDEPGLDTLISRGVENENLTATTTEDSVKDARAVGITLNAPNDQIENYLDVIAEYGSYFLSDQTIINRTTLPTTVTDDTREILADTMDIDSTELDYITFPERLSEGHAIKEIEILPKIVGTADATTSPVIEWLTNNLSGETYYTDHKTASFIKLMDNTYRDARFAIANQFAHLAEQIGVDSHEAIALANRDYSRNNIPTPGTVGGKCLTKDPHFLTNKWIKNISVDLFASTREVNESYTELAIQHILKNNPETVTVLGTGYKRNMSDKSASPAVEIVTTLESLNVDVETFEPLEKKKDNNKKQKLTNALSDADVVVLAVNHRYFEQQAKYIQETVDVPIVDIWGLFNPAPNVNRVGSGKTHQR